MNDNDMKRFEDAMKKAEADPGLDFFKDLDPQVPPASTFIVGENNESSSEIPIEEKPADDKPADETPRLPVKKKSHNRRVLYTLAPVAACVCIAFVALFNNSQNNAGTSSMDMAAAEAPQTTEWATAGENYSALYEMIDAYKTKIYSETRDELSLGVMSDSATVAGGGMDMGAAEALAPAPPAALAPQAAPTAPGGGESAPDMNTPGFGEGTAGSGYQDDFDFETEPPSDEPGVIVPEEPPAQQIEDPVDEPSAEPSGDPTEGQTDDQAGEQATPDFSDTNEQVVGVREADIVKTDGKFIYGINSNNLFIVDVQDDEMNLVSKIPQTSMSDGQVYFEMYLAGDRLIAIRHGYNSPAYMRMEAPAEDNKYEVGTAGSGYVDKPTCIIYPIGGYFTDTSVDIFDISDRADPKLLHTLSQSGDYRESRMIDGMLYLITNYYGGDVSQMDKNDPRTYVPLYAENGEQLMPAPEDIILPGGETWPSFTLISGIDAVGSGKYVSKKSVYGECSNVYSSTQAVYITRTDYSYEEKPYGEFIESSSLVSTVITKADLDNGHVDIKAVESVPGSALNQFSFDEYKGVLRLVTTNDQNIWYSFREGGMRPYQPNDWDRLPPSKFYTSNALYTLDSSLNIIGKVEDLARDERVYSCRFMGDIAYFVTFRQTDPLFSVDLSDPSAPKVLDALKIPGFSEYLHPYAEGELFGLGRDADPNTGRQKGIKLSMFDNSNPSDLKEKTTLLVENEDSYSSAETNHKAILVSSSRKIIAFPIQQWEDAGPLSRYLIYTYDESDGFAKVAEITVDTGEFYSFAELRGLFIGDTFYVVGPNTIGAYAMNASFEAFAEKQILRIDTDATSVNRYSYHSPGIIMPLVDPVIVIEE